MSPAPVRDDVKTTLRRRSPAAWPRLLALAVAVALAWLPWTTGQGRARTRDTLERALRPHRPATRPMVAVVALDLTGAERIMPFGHKMPRKMMAATIRRLTEMGARTIAIEGTPADLRNPAEDADLIDAMKTSGRCVVAAAAMYDPEQQTSRLIPPAPPFAAVAHRIGFLIGGMRADLSRNTFDPREVMGPARLRPLAVEAAAAYLDADRVGEEGAWFCLAGTAGEARIPVHGPGDLDLEGVAIVCVANNPRMDYFRLADVLDPARSGELARAVAGKVVVLGKPSVFAHQKEMRQGSGQTDPAQRLAELGLTQADSISTAVLIQNLLGGGFVRDAASGAGLLALPAFLLVGLLFWRLPARAGLAAALLMIAGSILGTAFAYRHGVLVNAIAASGGVLLLWGVQALVRVIQQAGRSAALEAELARAVDGLRAEGSLPDTGPRHGDVATGARTRLASLVYEFLPERYAGAEFLGQGGMGVVFRAHDTVRGVPVAVKVLSPLVRENKVAVKRFELEARTLERLAHPGIVRVLDIDLGLLPLFSMELLEGAALSALIDAGPMPVERAVAIARQLAQALGHVHAAGVVHRDLKPSNVMMLKDDRAKLLDFGLAKDEDRTRQTNTGDVLGTLRYMPPEQFAGRAVSPATDVYALALILCELLTGQAPERRATGHALPRAQLASHGVPPTLIDLLDRALSEDPSARPANGAQLADQLAASAKT